MSGYRVVFHKQVENDLKKLDNSVLIFFDKKLKQVINNPEIGVNLGNKLGLDLSGFKKVYFLNKKFRIVYKMNKDEIIIYILSVGKRENLDVYKEAYHRLLDNK